MKNKACKGAAGGGGGGGVFAIKLFLASLAFLTLLLSWWQLQLYGFLEASVARSSAAAARCSLLATTTAAADNTTEHLPSAANTTNRAPAVTVAPTKRALQPYGSAAALFVQMGAYRGGTRTFAVVGLASKPAHVFGTPDFTCEWQANPTVADPAPRAVRAKASKILPDKGYGRVYTLRHVPGL
jgi:hypothetical protein